MRLIDADALSKSIKDGDGTPIQKFFADVCVAGAPTVDAAPVVHGKWIYGEDIDIQCSVCGADALTEGDYRQIKSRYCPNCGAKMDWED